MNSTTRHRTTPRRPLLLTVLFAAACPLISPAAPVEELVVSGYRPVRPTETETSLTLLDRRTVERASVANFEELVRLVPNMNLSGEASRARYFQLRGIGEREQYEGAPNPSVGFVVDDIDLSGIGGVTSTYDVTQVEVLRGPQSTRYGSSALAGMVYVQTAEPGDEPEFRAEVTGGTEDTRAGGVALGGPLAPGLSGRLSAYLYRDDGFRTNSFLGRDDTNRRDELSMRGKLRWAIGDAWTARLTALYLDFDNGYDAFALDNGDTTRSDEPGRDKQETAAGALRLTGRALTGADFVSITTFADSDIDFAFDADWVNEQDFLPIVYDYRYRNPRERNTLSQEFRLVSDDEGRLFGGTTDWVVGVYLERLEEDNRIDSTGDYVDTGVGCDPGFCFADKQVASSYEADTAALFAGLESRLGSRASLSAGLRLERWDADYRDTWRDNAVLSGAVVVNNAFSPADNLLGGHVAFGWDWSNDVRSYVRLARGFKAGGFNPSLEALGGPVERAQYRPEALWSLEAGVKGTASGGALVYDLAVFGMRRDDAQLSQSDQLEPFDPNTFVFVTYNGEARSVGLEASLEWALGERWAVHGALGLLDTEIEEWEVRPAVEGRDLAHAPRYTLNVGADWTGPAGLFARLDVNAVDAFYFDISHDRKSDDYRIVNLRIGREWSNWTVSAWGRNIFDESYATRGFFFGNEPPAFTPQLYTRFGDPRQVGITLEYRWD